jgi:hypothetical protein
MLQRSGFEYLQSAPLRDDVDHRSRRLMARVSAMISRTGSPLSG